MAEDKVRRSIVDVPGVKERENSPDGKRQVAKRANLPFLEPRHGELPIVQSSCEASRSSAPTFPRSKSYFSPLFTSLISFEHSEPFFFPLSSPSPAEHYLSFSHHVRPAGFDCNFSRVNARRRKKAGLKKRIETPFLFFSDTDGGGSRNASKKRRV